MTRHSIGVGLAVFCCLLGIIGIEIHNHMQRIVARLAPPKTNRPLKNLLEALNSARVRRECARFFPLRSRKKFLWMRATTIAEAMCFLGGMALVLWTN